jgi:glucose uptake protein GlcU
VWLEVGSVKAALPRPAHQRVTLTVSPLQYTKEGIMSSEIMPSESDKLIYQNSNTYRLHADNLRWSLLGGYAVFLAAIVSFAQPTANTIDISQPIISLLAFLLSFAYFWILAVQNWFYNLFAKWVDDCEYRLVAGIHLQSLHSLAKAEGNTVNPFHPAFFLAELLVGTIAYFFLALTIKNSTIPTWLISFLWVLGMILYFALLNVMFLKWDKLVYKPIIMRLSNIYKPVKVETDTNQKNGLT